MCLKPRSRGLSNAFINTNMWRLLACFPLSLFAVHRCRERSSLVSIIDAQRRELELREKAQQDALHVAENFATAIQSFEERLLVVEQTTSQELGAMRELLQRQSAATELILQSLGISQPPPAPSSLSASSSGSQSLARRETK